MPPRNLESQLGALEHKATLLEDIVEIINLQARFNYYLELNETDRIVDELFAQDDPKVSCEIADSGIYEGIESIRRFWNARREIQSIRGYLGTVMLESPHVQISKDGNRARGVWHGFGPNSIPLMQEETKAAGQKTKLVATWYMGKYENEYVKESGKWRIASLHAFKYVHCPYDRSWIEEPDVYRFAPPSAKCRPDRPGKGHSPYDPAAENLILPSTPEPRGLSY